MEKLWIITSSCCETFQTVEQTRITLHGLNQHYRMRPRKQSDWMNWNAGTYQQYFCDQQFLKMPKHNDLRLNYSALDFATSFCEPEEHS